MPAKEGWLVAHDVVEGAIWAKRSLASYSRALRQEEGGSIVGNMGPWHER